MNSSYMPKAVTRLCRVTTIYYKVISHMRATVNELILHAQSSHSALPSDDYLLSISAHILATVNELILHAQSSHSALPSDDYLP